MRFVTSALALLLPGFLSPSVAQSLYTPTPGAFVAVGTFERSEALPNEASLGIEAGYRLSSRFDFSLGGRYAASQTTVFDLDIGSSTWEVRPGVTYYHPLGSHAVVQIRALLNLRFFDEVSRRFGGGGIWIDSYSRNADIAALLSRRVRRGEWLALYPSVGLYHIRTLDDDTDAGCLPVELPEGGTGACGIPGYGFDVRNTGVQFALPVSLRLGKRYLAVEPSLRYALTGTYPTLEPIADLSLRFNF